MSNIKSYKTAKSNALNYVEGEVLNLKIKNR